MIAPTSACASSSPDYSNIANRAKALLLSELENQSGWLKVHAAEALLSEGEMTRVRAVFTDEERCITIDRNGNEADAPALWTGSTRIGLWRVLAASSDTPKERSRYVTLIEKVFLDENNPSRVHALESLCKLGVKPTGELLSIIQKYSKEASSYDALYAHWALCLASNNSPPQKSLLALAEALKSNDSPSRLRAAYIIRRLAPRQEIILSALRIVARNESADTPSCAYVWGAAFTLLPGDHVDSPWRQRLEAILENGGLTNARYEASQCLLTETAIARANISRFNRLLDSPDVDTRIGAAWALLAATRDSALEIQSSPLK